MPKPSSHTAKLIAAMIASGAFAAGTAEAAQPTAARASAERQGAAGLMPPGLAPFTASAQITNPWLPLSAHREAILVGDSDGHAVRSVRTLLEPTYSVPLAGRDIRAAVIEARSYSDGVLRSAARSYYVQADDGTVYRLAVEIDHFDAGGSRMVAHDRSSIDDRPGRTLRVAMPAAPRDGQRFDFAPRSGLPGSVRVIDTNARLTVPIGSFNRVLVVHARPAAGGPSEIRYYARGVGLIKQQGASGTLELAS